MTLKLKIIIASTRPGRKGPIVADWVKTFADEFGQFEVDLVDLAELDLPLLDEPKHPAMKDYQHDHTKRWSAIIDGADAFVFVTPEYDFFAPAALVNAIQCLSREWKYKPAAIVSYGGISGGLRSTQELRLLFSNVGGVALPQSVPMPFFNQFIGEDGIFTPNEPMLDGIKLTFTELLKWATALKPMRETA
ncbi:MAG: NAD(P)H-dependent oxidoreductase [Salaquimonas sp.]|jgi:NAD(P)H-dependent FMN reductase|nr:NAD(P)H-dependent oxidoreductase [Salaquimonas sp.]